MRGIPEKDIHKGHRKRMREKLSRHGSEIFDTYELLEMLLYLAIPVQDTNPIAKRLLAAFGSLSGVFSAKREELLLVEGVGERCADMILAAGDVLTLYGEARTLPLRDFSDYRAVGEFFTDYFGNAEDYRVALLLLDNAMRPIAIKTLYNVDYSSAAVLPRPFVEAALLEGASVAIVAHTHPFGPIIPSYYDRETNSLISAALADVGVTLAEHYITVGQRYAGFMQNPKLILGQDNALEAFYESKKKSVSEVRDGDTD